MLQRSGRICFIYGVCRNSEPICTLRSGIFSWHLAQKCQELHRRQARSPLQIDIETYIIFEWKNNFLSPSVFCPDTSKRVPQIMTATETE